MFRLLNVLLLLLVISTEAFKQVRSGTGSPLLSLVSVSSTPRPQVAWESSTAFASSSSSSLSPWMEGLKKYDLPNKLTLIRVFMIPVFMATFVLGLVSLPSRYMHPNDIP